jgi:hypothetical protein
MVDVLALTLTWTPGIRGVLVVAVGIIVLMGSVYLILGTNSGFRLGFLLALTGLMGWMVIMGVVWMIYGIGRTGPAPTWEVLEMNRGDLTAAELEEARTLPEPDALPEPSEFLEKDDKLRAQFEQQPRPPTLGDLLGVRPEIQDDLPLEGDWHLLSTSDPQTGEAQATASAYLVEERKLFESSSDYVVLEAYSKGGKDRRDGDENSLERAGVKIKNSLTLFHPPHYAVVQVQKAVEQAEKPGQPPPIAVPDENEPVISVIMERNLGAKRRPSFFLTLFSLAVFLVCCNTLNRRERLVNEARSNLPAKV